MIKKVNIYSALFFLISLLGLFSYSGYTQVHGTKSTENQTAAKKKKVTRILYGQASYYATKFEGRRTANGETFRHNKLTAACNVLPLGTWIKITNLRNGKTVVVQTNDRLHKKTRRIVDLTRTAAKKLGFVNRGLTRVKIEVLNKTPA